VLLEQIERPFRVALLERSEDAFVLLDNFAGD
jgi:hypothetical protein